MKIKHALLIFILGVLITMIGALFKIQSYENAELLLNIGTFLELIGGVLLLYKVFTHPKFKDFLNQ